jgi:4,5-dihydroxyphthalate decarboxylase
MARLQLSFVTGKNERIEPLLDGSVQIEGVDLVPTYSDPSETFWRQLNFQEFQISEMSISSYLIAHDHGADMVMIPVYPSRRFFHTGHSYHVDSGIKGPGDLAGKRVGVGEYQQTASLWFRGVIEHDFGVSQYDIEWWMERTEEMSHGGATGFTPPPGIKFQRVPPDKSLATMLVNKELDAATIGRVFSREWNLVDRSTTIRPPADTDWSKMKPLFPNLREEATRFVKAHGFVPANHGYAIRGDVYREHPWVAFNFYKACLEAKQVWRERFSESIPSGLFFGSEYQRLTRDAVGDDPFVYGLKGNRDMLQTAVDYSFEQGLIKEKPRLEDLLAESTRDL